jgi:hypothetical protein
MFYGAQFRKRWFREINSRDRFLCRTNLPSELLFLFKKLKSNWVWWHAPVIPAGRGRIPILKSV